MIGFVVSAGRARLEIKIMETFFAPPPDGCRIDYSDNDNLNEKAAAARVRSVAKSATASSRLERGRPLGAT
jgi:hypothetical protein